MGACTYTNRSTILVPGSYTNPVYNFILEPQGNMRPVEPREKNSPGPCMSSPSPPLTKLLNKYLYLVSAFFASTFLQKTDRQNVNLKTLVRKTGCREIDYSCLVDSSFVQGHEVHANRFARPRMSWARIGRNFEEVEGVPRIDRAELEAMNSPYVNRTVSAFADVALGKLEGADLHEDY